jgi:hypothetical protein
VNHIRKSEIVGMFGGRAITHSVARLTPGAATRPTSARRRWARGLAVLLLVVGWHADDTSAGAAELVMFESALCEWCEAWHAQIGDIYPKTAEARVAPLRRVDLHGPRPTDLRRIGPVVYTPTFVLLEAGREVGRIVGYPGEDHFWGLLGVLVGRLNGP